MNNDDKYDFNFNQIFKQSALAMNDIIKLYDIINLIDDIFYTWLSQIKNIDIYIKICHANCHINFIIDDKTNSACCYCGNCEESYYTK